MRFAIVRLLTGMRSMLACQRGQVVIIFSFAAMILVLAVGMAIDLWQAYATKANLQAAVDAAALAIASTDRTAYTTAQLNTRASDYVSANYPTAALGSLCGTATWNTLSGSAACPTLLSYGATPNIIIVADSAIVPTTFMRIWGVDSLTVTTSGQAQAAWPYINFYLLLDDSPSMGIAATGSGVTTMVNNTSSQGGCGFGCHETNPAADSLGNPSINPCPSGTPASVDGTEDNYTLAQCLGVQLRIALLQEAAANLMTTAQNTENANSIADEYQMAIYTFDYQLNTIQALTSNLTTAATAASNIQLLEVCDNNNLTTTTTTTTTHSHGHTTTTTTISCSNPSTLASDSLTNFDAAMSGINTIMPNPGFGTQSPGDTPREVLFFVTDGVEDEAVSSCTESGASGADSPYVTCTGSSPIRQQSAMYGIDSSTGLDWCTSIKNRGILIAVLYTEYDALPTNSWYMDYVSPYNQPAPPVSPDLPTDHSTGIANTLYNCASPGLYTKVATGGDISGALSQLFITAVNSVYLSQ